jgi:tetratricopeptide (TPR) repeat protein
VAERASADDTTFTARVELGIRLAEALGFFWVLRGRGRENLARVRALAALSAPGTAARARAVTVAAHVHGHMLGDYPTAVPLADEGLSIWRALGDSDGIAVALVRRGQIAFETGEYHLAEALLAEARVLFRELGRGSGPEVPTDFWLAEVALARGDVDRVQQLYDEILDEARACEDIHLIGSTLRELARLCRMHGDPEHALTMLRESAALHLPLKDLRCACILLEDIAGVLARLGEAAGAAQMFGASEALRALIGKPLTRAQLATHDRDLASVKRQLAPESFDAAWTGGLAMTLEQAMAFAAGRPAPV